MTAVARYVQDGYAKPAYAVESFDVRAWPGLAMVVDALQRAGHEVDYCTSATVREHRVILVSITSACDWWSYIAERQRWPAGDYKVIVGGPGVLNIRPFLRWADAFVFGRAEDIIAPLAEAVLRGDRYEHPSVAWADNFSADQEYRIAQAAAPYPHPVRLESGKTWQEAAVGCQRRCLYCAYTWHRRNVGGLQVDSGAADAMWASSAGTERTMFELDLRTPGAVSGVRIVGLDGTSERLRRMVNKPITREMVRLFYQRLHDSPDKPQEVKLYCVTGYPGETREDWWETREDLETVDAGLPGGKQWKLVYHFTPFRAMPATPAACWPMAYREHRGKIAAALKCGHEPGLVWFQGNRFWALESMGTDSLATVALDAVALRGTEHDSDAVAAVARTRRFWAARSADKLATLERRFDMDRLFGAWTWETLPTRYLRTYARVERAPTAPRVAGGPVSGARP